MNYHHEKQRADRLAGQLKRIHDAGFDWEFVEDALREYADALTSGELDGAGRYLPEDIEEQAHLISVTFETEK